MSSHGQSKNFLDYVCVQKNSILTNKSIHLIIINNKIDYVFKMRKNEGKN